MKREDRGQRTEVRGQRSEVRSQKINWFVCFLSSVFCLLSSASYASEPLPRELEGVNIEEHLGEKIDLHLTFQDELGQTVELQKFFHEKPVILSMVYYECPNLCQFLLNGLTDSLKKLSWTVGEEFELIHVSINPQEKPELARKKRESHLKEYGRALPEGVWNFLVGNEDNIRTLANQIGFQYRYDEDQKQYAHAAAVMVLTPDGALSRYLYGVQFEPRDLKLALMEASHGNVGNIVEKLLLFCYHYDPKTRRYALFAKNVMRGGGVVTVGGIILLVWMLRRKGRKISL